MRNGKICTKCGAELSAQNTNPSSFKRQDGICRLCHQKKWHQYKKEHPDRVAASDAAYKRSRQGRHMKLKRALRKDRTPATDLLWSKNFYFELIKDLVCHYCSQPIKGGGHILDRLDNNSIHSCNNVVLCCWDCNELKSNKFSYDEMMRIAPVLKQIFCARLVEQQTRQS